MRMWLVDARILCRHHLLGEHSELHRFRHDFIKKHSMTGRMGQIEPVSMKARHDELVAEMIRRGYNHQSPYEQPDVSYLPEMTVDREASLKLLLERCERCARRWENNID